MRWTNDREPAGIDQPALLMLFIIFPQNANLLVLAIVLYMAAAL